MKAAYICQTAILKCILENLNIKQNKIDLSGQPIQGMMCRLSVFYALSEADGNNSLKYVVNVCFSGISPDIFRTESNMTPQEIKVYREIQRNADMAMKAIDTIAEKVEDEDLSFQISRQSLKYSELHNEAVKQLIDAKTRPLQSSHLSDAMLKTGLRYNTMLNTSTSHLAELLIRENNNGIIQMEKVLKANGKAGEKSTALAKQLIDFEEKSVRSLKDYL